MIDLAIIGGGIVGLASAWTYLDRHPGRKVVVLDKEAALALHQTGRNSGVIHSGIYYTPGSLKAQTCRRGKALLEAFCKARAVPFESCGKVIVATDDAELPGLQALLAKGEGNGVDCALIDGPRLREIEPHVSGIAALHVPEAGIVDYRAVCEALGEGIRDLGGDIRLGCRVSGISQGGEGVEVEIAGEGGAIQARRGLNCAGLYSDKVAAFSKGFSPGPEVELDPVQIIPFRGEYFTLAPRAEGLCKGLIYPVPDARFPFLGVHLTKMIGGGVECGPNAVLAMAREGYTWGDINLGELWETLSYPGFRTLAGRHLTMGMGEIWRSLFKAAFVRGLQRLVPDVRGEDLIPAPAGVRAQALKKSGELLDDFAIAARGPMVNVINAPSPAATASLAIAELIVDGYLQD